LKPAAGGRGRSVACHLVDGVAAPASQIGARVA
jgi:hypothetical protein